VPLGDAGLGPALRLLEEASDRPLDVGVGRRQVLLGHLDPDHVEGGLALEADLTPLLGDDRERAERIIHELFTHYTAHSGDLPEEFARIPGDVPTRVADFVAGMTDGYAIRTHAALTGEAKAPAWDDQKDVD
jgi:hypothetical protein